MKVLRKIVLTVVSAALLLFVAARYGWRLMGYSACDDPQRNVIEQVTLTENTIQITGETADSLSSYIGYLSHISDGSLYLGIKHNAFFGFFQRIGSYSIIIPTQGQPIRSLYLKGAAQERLVWTQEGGLIAGDAFSETPSTIPSEDSTAADTNSVQASYPFDDADKQDDLCAILFLGYDAESADEAMARLCVEYPAIDTLFAADRITTFDAGGPEEYLILPKLIGTTLTVTQVQLNNDGTLEPFGDSVSTEAPLRILANVSDIVPSAQVTVEHGARRICFNPFLSLNDGQIAAVDGVYAPLY